MTEDRSRRIHDEPENRPQAEAEGGDSEGRHAEGGDAEEREARARLEQSYAEAGVESVEERADRFGHPEGEDFAYEDPDGNRYTAEQWKEYLEAETAEQRRQRVEQMLETADEAFDRGI